MALEIVGKLHHIYDLQQITDTFSKREFVLELTDESPSGMVYTNYATFQLVNNNCGVIDRFNLGDSLKVSFNIRGNRWERDGKVKYITNLNAWRIEPAGVTNPGSESNLLPTSGTTSGTPTPFKTEEGATSTGNPLDPTEGDDLPF